MRSNHQIFASLLSEPSVRSLIRRIQAEGGIRKEVFSGLDGGVLSDSVRQHGLVAMISFLCPSSQDQKEPLPRGREGWEESFESDENFSRYFADIGRIPQLSEIEEQRLYRQIAVCTDPEEVDRLRQKLAAANLRFVVYVAKGYRGRGLKLMDLIEAGNEGIVVAARRFDSTRGFKFTTYAVWWIRHRIHQALKDNYNRVVRFPENQIQDVVEFKAAEAKLGQFLKRPPTDDELSECLGVSPERVVRLRELTLFNRIISLDAPVNGSEKTEIGDLLADPDSPEPIHKAEQEYIREMIQQVVGRLSPQEAAVLRVRYGLKTGKEETLDGTAQILGSRLRKKSGLNYGTGRLTRERVRQIEERALRRCREIWQKIHGRSVLADPALTSIQDIFRESQKEVTP